MRPGSGPAVLTGRIPNISDRALLNRCAQPRCPIPREKARNNTEPFDASSDDAVLSCASGGLFTETVAIRTVQHHVATVSLPARQLDP